MSSSKMCKESERVASFVDWPHAYPLSPRVLAQHGFYYCRETNGIRCSGCALEYVNIMPDFFLDTVHERMNCRFASVCTPEYILYNASAHDDRKLFFALLKSLPSAEPSDLSARVFDESPRRCGVCLENERDACLVPCGHLVCMACSANLNSCPFCRRERITVQRMYTSV
ncbi:IAP [Orgyia pseudotsugata single capsid nuclopolyhedrovirus]|nr:IAP [Orgyia pseudotsugata single capsid nuclopolyhedrovirus]